MPRTTSKSKPHLTARQRRNELIAILSIAAARMPLAVAIPPDSASPPHVKKNSQNSLKLSSKDLDVSAEMPLSVTTG